MPISNQPSYQRKKRRIITSILTVAVLALGIFALVRPEESVTYLEVQDNRFLLDTVVNIHLYGTDNAQFLENVFESIEEYESLLSRHKQGSDISKMNSAAVGMEVSISFNTQNVLQTALHYASVSAGVFDPTVGPLVDLWGIGSEGAKVPSSSEITEALSRVDYKKVSIDRTKGTASLQKSGMTLDLGGVAKGWIADRIAEELKTDGVAQFLINLGGNVLVSGGKPGGKSFRIGMQDPFNNRGSYLGVFSVKNRSIVSSGIYERYFELDGVRYHHILDTKSGYPVDNGLASVTILTEDSVDGDALSTTVFALGLDAGLELVTKLEGTEAAFVTIDGEIILTQGAAEIFEAGDDDRSITVR